MRLSIEQSCAIVWLAEWEYKDQGQPQSELPAYINKRTAKSLVNKGLVLNIEHPRLTNDGVKCAIEIWQQSVITHGESLYNL